jgi:hypothetical protein
VLPIENGTWWGYKRGGQMEQDLVRKVIDAVDARGPANQQTRNSAACMRAKKQSVRRSDAWPKVHGATTGASQTRSTGGVDRGIVHLGGGPREADDTRIHAAREKKATQDAARAEHARKER